MNSFFFLDLMIYNLANIMQFSFTQDFILTKQVAPRPPAPQVSPAMCHVGDQIYGKPPCLEQ